MFFEKRTQSSVKHRRLKYIALLLMRCALIALVAMLFAKPYVRRPVTAGDAQGRKMLLVAIDNSFSMRAGSRMEDAKAKALEVVGNFRAGDRGQVIAFASGAQLLTQPITEATELQAAVRSIQAGDGRSAYGEIARVIRTLTPPDGM